MTSGTSISESIKSTAADLAKTLGIVGGLGGVLTAFAFVAGYIATKAFDEMLGIPTSTTLEQTYVRIGVMFIPNSAHHMAAFIASTLTIKILILGLVVMAAVAFLIIWPVNFKYSNLLRLGLTILANIALVWSIVSYLPHHMAPNHPYNKRIAFSTAPSADTEGLSDFDRIGLTVNATIRDKRNTVDASRLYGSYVTATLAMVLLVPIWLNWARSLRALLGESATHDPGGGGTSVPGADPGNLLDQASLRVVEYFGVPSLLIAIFVCIITLPSNYGSIVLQAAMNCGVVEYLPDNESSSNSSTTEPGLLLSDLSNPDEPVVFLGPGDEDDPNHLYTIRQFDRDKEIVTVQLWVCPSLHGS